MHRYLAIAIVTLLALPATSDGSGIYETTILSDNPIGYWRLGEDTGSTADNIGSGSGIDGTYDGGVTLGEPALIADGASGGDTAVSFDGSDDIVRIPANTGSGQLSETRTTTTIELWFNTTTTGDRQFLYEQGGGTNGYVFFLEGDDLVAGLSDNNAYDQVVIADAVATDTTYYAAMVFDAGAPSLKVFLKSADGSQDLSNEETTGLPPDVSGHTGQGSIGGVNGTGNSGARISSGVLDETTDLERFAGTIDEVAVYGTALSDTTIEAHFQAGLIPEPSTLILAGVGLLGLLAMRRRRK